jgi:hypothetical protein
MAEQFGSALGMPQGLRNADNDLKLSQVSNEVHAISQVNTGAVYDIMADIFTFEKNRQAATKDPARVLLEVAANLCSLYLRALIAAPATGATFADVANQMLQISNAQGDPPIYRTFIRNRYTVREVVVSPTPLNALMRGAVDYNDPNFVDGSDTLKLEPQRHASDNAAQDRSACCGTMQLPENRLGERKKMQAGAAISVQDLLATELVELSRTFS